MILLDKIALIDDKGRSYTYEQLNIEQSNFAKLINANCLMFLVCTNTIECIVAYVSCIHNKIPVLLVDKNILPERYDKLVSDFKPDYIYMPLDSRCINNDYDCIYENRKYNLLKRFNANNNIPMYEELALLISTSGSSGSNKHVRISYDNLSHNTYAIAKALNICKDDVAITSLPMNYCYGLSVINTHLYCKATILVTEETIVSKKFWNFANEYKATTFAGVPYSYETIKKLRLFKRLDRPFEKLLHSGGKLGEEASLWLRQYARENDANLYLMYGQTEATARMTLFNAKDGHVGSVGKALDDCKISIYAHENEIARPYEKGEIIFEGLNVSLGYATSRDDLKLKDVNNGVINTGDIGYTDEEGYLYIVARKDRVVKINGLRIKLDEIEQLLKDRFG